MEFQILGPLEVTSGGQSLDLGGHKQRTLLALLLLMVFVVRDDASRALLLYVEPVTTYEAYNNWPHNHSTGKSLYGYNSEGSETISDRTAAVKVSFDRPYADSGVGNLFAYDEPFAAWLERGGYDVTYATSVDLDEEAPLPADLRTGTRTYRQIKERQPEEPAYECSSPRP